MWTKESLSKLVKNKLEGYKFIIASNREPYMHEYKGKEIKCTKTISGLTIALDPVMQATKGVWIAWASGSADRDTVDENNCVNVPPNNPSYTLKRLWLSKQEEESYYYGYSNQALWPLSHIAYEKPVFLKEDWQIYKKVNQRFAQAILDEIRNNRTFIWLQDYHLTLAAKYIKEKNPNTTVALSWHIPWPNSEVFRICPQKKEILAGLLSCDLLGFHIRYHCTNFMNTVDFQLEANTNYEENSIIYRGHKTLIRPFPISVNFEGISTEANSQEVKLAKDKLPEQISSPYEILALSVDRIDYTKGILERLRAIDKFLEKYPEYQKKFVFYQIGALSRIHIKSYKDLINKVQQLADEINWKYKSGNWFPIILNNREIDYGQHLALYRSADLCIVSSLHDGMNLVAKEFIAANVDLKGVLILSQFTGSARELSKGAILINPYDFDSTADAIKKAVQMPKEERIERMQKMRNIISEKNIYRWAGKFVSNLAGL